MDRWTIAAACLFVASAVALAVLAEERVHAWRHDRALRRNVRLRGQRDLRSMNRSVGFLNRGDCSGMGEDRGVGTASWADATDDQVDTLAWAIGVLRTSHDPEAAWQARSCEQRGWVCCEGPLEAMPANCQVRGLLCSGELHVAGMDLPASWGAATVDD